MSVRPITESEERLALGNPISSFMALFGASQGLLTHLRMNGLNVHANWCPTTFAKISLPLLVGGGLVAGFGLGVFAFGDLQLVRLANQHRIDRMQQVESAKWTREQA